MKLSSHSSRACPGDARRETTSVRTQPRATWRACSNLGEPANVCGEDGGVKISDPSRGAFLYGALLYSYELRNRKLTVR